ncbi:MAG: glycoside hydrolase family 16 protein [candidate division FCPU426 bacterium]
MKFTKMLTLGCFLAMLGSCASVGGWKEGGGWKLVWSDEFDKDGAPDPSKWGYETGFVRNEELQFYTKDRRENARVEKGVLVIEARKETWPNPGYVPGASDWQRSRQTASYTSAALETHGHAEWTYGRFEVRAKLPAGRGMWPAAWMLGSNIGKAGWPLCGEIDIMENVGFDPDKAHFTVHTKAFNHAIGTAKGTSVPLPSPDRAFHDYAMEWSPKKIDFYLDGRWVFAFLNDGGDASHWPFDKPQYLILNSAVGGGWGGQKGLDDSIFPARYEIDYVRVWQKN